MADRVVTAILRAKIDGYISPMRAARQATVDLTNELDRAAKTGKLDVLASSATRAGLLLVGGFAAINFAAARFEKQMSAVGAVSDATGAEMDQLAKAALKAGKDTKFSATEAAVAQEELAKAGLSTADILGGGLAGALSLAAAGDLELAEAAEVSAKAMNVFNLEGRDVGHVADVLAAAANKSATDVHELAFALKMGGLAAKQSGISLEETVGTFALFADNALSGSDAGTSFKQMLLQLASPSDVAQGLMKKLGVNAYDAGGNFIGLAGLADVLKNQLSGLTQEQRTAALATIFGADAMRAATVLYEAGGEGVRHYTKEVDAQGFAQEVASKKTDNLMGDIERLTGSMETLAIQAGSGTNQALRFLTQGAGALVDTFSRMPGPVQSTVTSIAGLAGISLLAFGGFLKLRQKTQEMTEALAAMGPSGERAARGVGKVTSALGKGAVAFAAFEVASLAASAVFRKELNPQLDAAEIGLSQFVSTGKLSGESARLFGENAEGLATNLRSLAGAATADKLANAWDWLPGVSDETANAKDQVAAFDAVLKSMVEAGHAQQAGQILEVLAAKAKMSVADLKKLLPAYAGAMEVGAGKTKELGGAAGAAAGELDELGESMRDNIIKAFSLEEAQDAAADAVADLAEQVKEQRGEHVKGSGALRGNTQAARDNREAVRELVLKYQDLIEKTAASGGKTAGLRQQLEDTLVKMGFSRAEVQKYTRELNLVPAKVPTEITTPGLAGARDRVERYGHRLDELPASTPTAIRTPGMGGAIANASALKRALDKIPNNVYIQIHYSGGKPLPMSRWGSITEHAQGGLLREATMFGGGPTRYAFAEAATGGEAFVPKRGNYARSMAILSQAADWYEANVVPRGGRGGGGAVGAGLTTNVTYQVNVGIAPGGDLRAAGKYVVEALRTYEQSNGRRWRTP